MKGHITVKLWQPVAAQVPSWLDFILDKSVTVESLEPSIDALLRAAGLEVWVTQEYQPQRGHDWSADEQAHGLDRTYRLILQRDYDVPPDLVERVRRLPAVAEARGLSVARAPLPVHQLTMGMVGKSPAELISLAYAKALTRGNPDVKIAVLDTGIDLAHRELGGKIAKGRDFVDLEGLETADFVGDITGYDDVPEDEVGHGTHVAGILCGRGVRMDEGVAPDCRLLAVRVLATMKSGDRLVGAGITDNINTGIKWAVDNDADVINMSLGIKNTGGGLPHEDVIRYALRKGATVVAASGNDGTAERYYPGALPGVIAVGAVDEEGAVTSFTSYGANISVVAPGVHVYSSFAGNGYAFASGTSQASPFVAGAVALMKSYARERGGSLSERDLTRILRETSDRVDTRLRNQHAGYGLINLADAFKLLNHLTH